MSVLTDNFSADTGQISSFIPLVTTGTPWAAGGSEAITGGQLVLTAPPAGSGAITGLLAAENSWNLINPNFFISTSLGLPTWQVPTPSGSANFGPGIVLDRSNAIFFEVGPNNSTTMLSLTITAIFSGVASTIATVMTPFTILPDAVGFALINNIITAYLSFGGVWRIATAIGSNGNVDISGFHDFTAVGALTGWRPGMIWGQIFNPNTTSIAVSQIQYTAPFTTPSATLLQTKFVPALDYKAIMVADPGSINPRIYPPQEDVTVRVKT